MAVFGFFTTLLFITIVERSQNDITTLLVRAEREILMNKNCYRELSVRNLLKFHCFGHWNISVLVIVSDFEIRISNFGILHLTVYTS
jgi:hypothetical protein